MVVSCKFQAYRTVAVVIAWWIALTIDAAADSLQNGYYAGIMFGLGNNRSTDSDANLPTFGTPISSAVSVSSGDIAPLSSLVFGKEWRNNDRFGFGVEFEQSVQGSRATLFSTNVFNNIVFRSSSTSVYSGDVSYSVPFQSTLRFRALFAITPAISAYASVGPALGLAREQGSVLQHTFGSVVLFNGYPPSFAANPFDDFSITRYSAWKFDPGLDVGGGLELSLSESISLRTEYSLTQFQTTKQTLSSSTMAGTASFQAAPLFQRVQIGLVQRF
jgi:opacity protein-like surface antigen